MNPGDTAYQQLLLDVVAPRLVAQGVDGFYFDNLEIVEHGTATGNGPCRFNSMAASVPRTRSIAKNRRPFDSPRSRKATMCG